MLDLDSEFGQRASRRLMQETIVWLLTVDRHGAPQSRPLWFYWDGASVLIFSRPDAAKIDHIRRNPRVALHFDGHGMGGDIVVMLGRAELDAGAGPASRHQEYLEKYAEGLQRIGMTEDLFSREYSSALRIHHSAIRGH